jgi:spindle assembly abnormal protein 6
MANLPVIGAPTRERQEMERKFREQIDTLSARVAELDTENRKLRDSKYDLDSKVRRMYAGLTIEKDHMTIDFLLIEGSFS